MVEDIEPSASRNLLFFIVLQFFHFQVLAIETHPRHKKDTVRHSTPLTAQDPVHSPWYVHPLREIASAPAVQEVYPTIPPHAFPDHQHADKNLAPATSSLSRRIHWTYI